MPRPGGEDALVRDSRHIGFEWVINCCFRFSGGCVHPPPFGLLWDAFSVPRPGEDIALIRDSRHVRFELLIKLNFN